MELHKTDFQNACTHNLSLGTLDNDRENLLKVTTKDAGKSTKRLFRVPQVSKSAIDCLHDMLMPHRSLIPNNQFGSIN